MKVLHWLDENIEKTMVAILFITFAGIMILNVIMRFVFQSALAWASEVVLTLFIWFVWFAVSYAFKESKHIRVTVLTGLMPEAVRKVLQVVVDIMILVFFAILIKTGIELIGHFSVKGKTSLLLNYPMWLFYLSAPVGMGLSMVRILQNGYKILFLKEKV